MSVVLTSSAKPESPAFAANEAAHRALVADLEAQLERVRAGGGERARERLGDQGELTAHFHNTSGQGLANVVAALDAGVRSFESSFGELGGCPVPRGATGNIATEDLVSMLHEMGHPTGIDLEALVECAREAQRVLGRSLGSHVIVAGPVDWHRA